MPIEDAPGLPEPTDSSPVAEVEAPTPDDAGTPQPRDEEGKFLSEKAQKRIDALTREKYDREREAQYWREQALQHQAKPEPVKVEPQKLPTLEEFGYDEAKYQSALIQYATQKAEETVNRRLSEVEQQRTEQSRIESFVTRQKEFAKVTPDFEDRVLRDPSLPITEAMRDVIVDSPSGPELAYYLATNREAAEQIARLPAHLAALEMGRIEGRLSAQKEAKARPLAVSKAPPPPPKVDDTAVEVEKDPEDMSVDQWVKWREKQLRKPRK